MNLQERFKQKSILVIGDVMLDIYFKGEVTRISPEAPVPVFKKSSERYVPGGAANVAMNLVSANQKVSMLSVIGSDMEGELLSDILGKYGVNTELLMKVRHKTTVKTRFLTKNNQQVLRLDTEETEPISKEDSEKLIIQLYDKIADFDILLISDYMKGLLTYEFTQKLIDIANVHRIRVLVDVKDQNAQKYKNAYLLKPNLDELYLLSGIRAHSEEEIISVSHLLREKHNVQYVLTTCGSRGMILVGDRENLSINSVAKDVYDVTGAGDTTFAYLAASLANGIDMKLAVKISNLAAGIQVGKVGTSVVTLQEVQECLQMEKQSNQKILDREEVCCFRNLVSNKRMVFTNGCFDILHVGHIRYLQEAARQGDVLVVGLNSDQSVYRLKGDGRPVNHEEERAELLCALECVDYVVIFDEDTPYELIKEIQPDILVKGGDYCKKEIIGSDIVRERNGQVRVLDYIEGKSTSKMIEQIRGGI